MSTQPIEHKGYGYTYRKPRKPQDDVDFPLGPEQSKKRQSESEHSRTTIRGRIGALLSDIPRGDDNTLTFNDIVAYRDSLEKDWDAVVSSDLAGLGVDVDRKFRLTHDPSSGKVKADSDHPDNQKIDQYFVSNQDMADDFEAILQLGKLVDVAERRLSPTDMGLSLTPEAMAWWFENNMDAASLFSGGGIIFGMGASAYKGLDIRV